MNYLDLGLVRTFELFAKGIRGYTWVYLFKHSHAQTFAGPSECLRDESRGVPKQHLVPPFLYTTSIGLLALKENEFGEKFGNLGEDAFFINKTDSKIDTFGVADGVGGWRLQGVDPRY